MQKILCVSRQTSRKHLPTLFVISDLFYNKTRPTKEKSIVKIYNHSHFIKIVREFLDSKLLIWYIGSTVFVFRKNEHSKIQLAWSYIIESRIIFFFEIVLKDSKF